MMDLANETLPGAGAPPDRSAPEAAKPGVLRMLNLLTEVEAGRAARGRVEPEPRIVDYLSLYHCDDTEMPPAVRALARAHASSPAGTTLGTAG
jgi:hypothetical protein